jgi:hypothetical protein
MEGSRIVDCKRTCKKGEAERMAEVKDKEE